MFKIKQINRVLGVAKSKRRYDLPLDKDSGGNFLKLLIALMSLLAMLALATSFTLSEITDRWSSGLKNKASIEIPAEDSNGAILSKEKIQSLTAKVETFLQTHPGVATIDIMQDKQIGALIAPWLGEDLALDNIPLPGIISVSFKNDIEFDMTAIAARLEGIAPQIRLDTHASWLRDVLRFTGALNFAAILITMVIGVTTIVAVAGAVRSRMAIYHSELELLHLMGAGDRYISRQLQRHTLFLALQGALVGAATGGIMLFIIGWSARRMDISLLPEFSLSGLQVIILMSLPILIAALGMLTARQTVLRVLAQMP